ncbi:bzip transcription factor [Niveomyces insectorum RCEF 264]|uniref:Bzip transcription factor n=1 Tax=Niveomyces insectorum RCEF 264 TaxID=1081102 RepID=A0A167NG54_9HYPO|nr:bzip transcription factor [Niveomyces insectorum RCEF 264]
MASFAPAPLAPAYDTKSNTPVLPASPTSSHDSPRPSKAASVSSPATSGKPQGALKPITSAPIVRPLQTVAEGAQAGNVMSMNSVMSPAPQSPAMRAQLCNPGKPPMSITSKEWVIPPRPKPGRKPATDTPPTKRKAQNRAAQRAFRERRAARVGELEEQLEEQKTEFEQIERDYQDKIRALEAEVQGLRSRCQTLENRLESDKVGSHSRANIPKRNRTNEQPPTRTSRVSSGAIHLQQHKPSQDHILSPIPHKPLHHNQPRGSASSSTSSFSGRPSSAQPFSISQIISPPDEVDDLTCGSCGPNGACACAEEALAATAAMGCGKCILGSKCACLEESINAFSNGDGNGNGNGNVSSNRAHGDHKRPHSTPSPVPLAPDEKKPRRDDDNGAVTEIDFTHIFSRAKRTTARTPLPPMPIQQPRQQLHQAPRIEIPQRDKCGFCSDGTYCVCADTMPGVTMTGSLALSTGTVVAQQKTPPPSENDRAPLPLEVTETGAVKLTRANSLRRQDGQTVLSDTTAATSQSKCGPGGPGTCAQCLADPVSGLFCRSLAANLAGQGVHENGRQSGGCCGGGGSDGGCCKDKNGPSASVGEGRSKEQQNISLSCADAYKTLASHRHFDEATDEIGTWLPKLRATPRRDIFAKPAATRHPMEVEAASIMSVLKGFDVRFGK